MLFQNSIGAGAPRLPLVDVADDNEKDETITTFCMAPTNPNQKGRLVFEKNTTFSKDSSIKSFT